jgi:hypothetical protein
LTGHFFFSLFYQPAVASSQDWTNPLLAAGQLKIEASSLYLFTSERFGKRLEDNHLIEEVEPLGFDFTSASVGSNLFPILSNLEDQLNRIIDQNDYSVILGSSATNLTRDAVRIPMTISVGISNNMTLGVTVPITRQRTEIGTSFNAANSNVGVNPSIDNTQQVDDFLDDLASVGLELSTLVQGFCNPGTETSRCLEAKNALQNTQIFHEALSQAYVGFGVFPLAGSDAGNLLQLRLDALSDTHSFLGVNSSLTTIPLATNLISQQHYQELITDPSYGVDARALQSWLSPWTLGDIEFFSNFKLLSSENKTSKTDLSSSDNINYLLGVGSLFRLGTGQSDLDNNLVDVGSGDGQNDFEIKLFANLSDADLWSLWLEASFGIQRPTAVTRRIALPHQAFPSSSTTQLVNWTPGSYTQVRFSPRYQLTKELAFSGDTKYFSKKHDQYSKNSGAACNLSACMDPKLLEHETSQSLFDIGGGFIFSDRSPERTRPIEIIFLYRKSVWGSGGRTPKTSHFQLGVKLFSSS